MPNILLTPPAYSHKTELGIFTEQVGQAIQYLSPAMQAYQEGELTTAHNLCPGHSRECFTFCLIHSGQMITPFAHRARIRRTKLLMEEPEAYGRQLQKEVDAHLRWCDRHKLFPAFRFNGTSDFNFESFPLPHLGETIHSYLLRTEPRAIVNEYTKRYGVMKRWLDGEYSPNLHMTYSLHEQNEHLARQILHLGGNVAMVFKVKRGSPVPSTWWGRPTLDGDVDDLRWLDEERAGKAGYSVTRGLVIALRAKGVLERHDSAFALDPQSQTMPLLRAA